VVNLEDFFYTKNPLWQNFAHKKTLHVISVNEQFQNLMSQQSFQHAAIT
jgi:hypothetical protein